MFLSQTRPRSIASQLVLLFTLAAAFLLSCGLGVFYLIVVRHAFEEDNEFLADRLSALRGELSQTGGLGSLTATLRNPRAGKVEAYWVRVIDSKGDIVTETPKMSGFLPPAVFPDPQDKNSVNRPKNYRTTKKLFSLVATMEEADGQPYLIQLAQDRSSDEQFATQFAFVLGGALGLGILASAIIAIAVTKRGLWPLQQMRQSLERIGPAHLDERVGKTTWPRELQPVATAFDEMLARLEISFTKLSQFSADLAHELRTPISNIRGEAEVALTRPRTSEDYRNVIESIAAECERLSGIVDNLLFLARAEAVDRQIERKVFAARPAIEKIAAYYRTIAEERGISITNKGDGEVYADPLLFDRALSNLLDNALRFTPDGGNITVTPETKPGRTELAVEDTGCGIPPQHLPHVCDRFYRVDSSRSSQGTGLGLALVKSITDLHGGSVAVASKVDRGTTVTLTFPAKGADDLLGGAQADSSKTGFVKMKIKVLFLLVVTTLNATGATIDTTRIDQLTGLKGKLNEKEGAYKISFTREDLTVSVDGWKIPAFMGLSTWAAFTKATHNEAMVMGDTVLFEDEVNLAMFVALESGLSVTALHNHFFFDHPRLFFMHIEGEGTLEHLASSVRLLYDKVREFRTAHPTPADSFLKPALPEVSTITADPLNKIFHISGEANKGMIKFTFGRAAKMHGITIDSTMGVNTWAAFAGSDENAVVDGDFAVTENELRKALKSLREAGINIVSIHSHMISEEPRIIFFHYWGRGSAQNLAQSIQKALPATAGTPAQPRASVR